MSNNDPSAGATPVVGGATPPQTPPATPPAADPTPDPQAAPATGAPDGLGDAGKRALEAMKAERKLALDRAKAAEDELEKLKTASQSDADKALAEAKKAGATEVLTRVHAQVRRSEVKAALTTAGINPEVLDLATRADEFAALKVTDEGEVEGLDDALKAFKAAKPGLFKVAAAAGPSGSADGGVRGTGKLISKEQLKKMSPAEINAAFDKGELAGLLKPGG